MKGYGVVLNGSGVVLKWFGVALGWFVVIWGTCISMDCSFFTRDDRFDANLDFMKIHVILCASLIIQCSEIFFF